jgi:pantetheine-phosphate adenylyltransferase
VMPVPSVREGSVGERKKTVAVYPGTFDPVHYGHIDIVQRAAKIFDYLIVAIYDRPLKNLLFSTAERLEMMQKALEKLENVEVTTYRGITAEYMRQRQAQVIVRGLRVTHDFELEYQMALTNKKLAPEIESVCLMTSLEHAFVSSSILKEIALAGGDVNSMAPPHVVTALHRKFAALGDESAGRVKIVSLIE